MEVLTRSKGATPEEVCTALIAALNAARTSAVAACLTRGVCLLTPDSTVVRGRADVVAVLAQLPVAGTQVETESPRVLASGEVSIVNAGWRFVTRDHEGAELLLRTEAVVVLTRVEGSWKVSLAAPWGWRGFVP